MGPPVNRLSDCGIFSRVLRFDRFSLSPSQLDGGIRMNLVVVRLMAVLTLILGGMSSAETDACTRCGLIVRPSNLSFPPQQIGTRSAPMTITVANGSTPSGVIIRKEGTGFQQSNNCP